jgi:hypothetical protein
MVEIKLSKEMLKISEEAKRKAIKKRLKELESAPFFNVDYPMYEFIFGCFRGGVPYSEWPEHYYNPRNTESLTRRYASMFIEDDEEEEVISKEEMLDSVIDYFLCNVDWEVDYEYYALKESDSNNNKKRKKAVIAKHNLNDADNLESLFSEHCE